MRHNFCSLVSAAAIPTLTNSLDCFVSIFAFWTRAFCSKPSSSSSGRFRVARPTIKSKYASFLPLAFNHLIARIRAPFESSSSSLSSSFISASCFCFALSLPDCEKFWEPLAPHRFASCSRFPWFKLNNSSCFSLPMRCDSKWKYDATCAHG